MMIVLTIEPNSRQFKVRLAVNERALDKVGNMRHPNANFAEAAARGMAGPSFDQQIAFRTNVHYLEYQTIKVKYSRAARPKSRHVRAVPTVGTIAEVTTICLSFGFVAEIG